MASRKEITLVIVTAFVCLLLLLFFTKRLTYSHPDFNKPWDHHKYIIMAHQPFNFFIAPFCWRILVPLLASLLPFEISYNFVLINFIALWASAVILYFLFRKMSFSKYLSFSGMLFFFSLGWIARYNIYNFWLVDSMLYLFLTILLWALFADRNILFSFLLMIGVMVKESILFVAPLYYTFRAIKLWDRKCFFRFCWIILPAILMFLVIRILIPQKNGDNTYLAALSPCLLNGFDENPYVLSSIFRNFTVLMLANIKKDPLEFFVSCSIGTFGVLPLFLFLFAIKNHAKTLLCYLPFVFLTFLTIFFAVNTERMLILIFPVFIIFVLYGVRDIIEKSGRSEKLFVFFPFMMFLCLLIQENWLVLPPAIDLIFTIVFVVTFFSRATEQNIF